MYYFHVSVGWTLAINFDIIIVKTSKNTKMQIFTKRGLGTSIETFKIIIAYKTPKNTLVQIFIKIRPVNQKLPKGG